MKQVFQNFIKGRISLKDIKITDRADGRSYATLKFRKGHNVPVGTKRRRKLTKKVAKIFAQYECVQVEEHNNRYITLEFAK